MIRKRPERHISSFLSIRLRIKSVSKLIGLKFYSSSNKRSLIGIVGYANIQIFSCCSVLLSFLAQMARLLLCKLSIFAYKVAIFGVSKGR